MTDSPSPRARKKWTPKRIAAFVASGCGLLLVLLFIIGLIGAAVSGDLGADPEPTAAPPTEASAESSAPTEPEATEASEPTTTPETTSAPEPTESSPQCEVEAGEGALAEDIMAADMPEGVVITSVTENRPDSDIDQSLTWVVVNICAENLSADDHRTVATDIAIAARDSAEGGDRIWRLSVGLWMPEEGEEYLQQGRSLYVEDFSMYTWSRDAAVPPESNWEDNSV